MITGNRPLSPHLQIYRPPLTMVLSFSHRATGTALFFGMLLFVYWLVAAAAGAEAYETARTIIGSWIGRLCLFGWTIALFYHLFNGIRHLIWDLGYGLGMRALDVSSWVVLIATGASTLLVWVAGYAAMGSF